MTRHQRLDNLDGTVFRAGLFIGGDQKRQPPFVVRVLSDKALCRHHHGRQRTFHIRRAAAEQHPVANGRLERWVDPAVGIARRHDVGVTGKRQRLPLSAPCPKILCIRKIHALNGKTDRAQAFNHQRLTSRIIRAQGRAANKLLCQLNNRARHRLHLVKKLLITGFTKTQQHRLPGRAEQWAFDDRRHFSH